MRILGIVILIAGLILFCQYQYLPALITIVIGSIFIAKPRPAPPEEDEGPPDEDPPNGELVRVETPLKKVRSANADFRRLTFPVDGVTMSNDDGSSRQEILSKLCDGEDMAVAEVWFDDFLYQRKVQIRVRTEEGCVGLIRQKDVDTVRGFFGKPVRMIYLEIGSSPNDEGEQEYHAEVVIIANREQE